jgi:hypothetical protein
MFVAVFESLFRVRLDGIIRSPITRADYINNAQRVIDGISQQIQMDLQHITGDSIVEGDLRALSNLVRILFRILNITSKGSQGSPREENLDEMKDMPIDSDKSFGDSISTHESAFVHELEHETSAGIHRIANKLSNSSSSRAAVRKVVAAEAQNFIRSSSAVLALEKKMEAARRRRELLRKSRESTCLANNRRRSDVSNRVLQGRWIEDNSREEDAHQLRKSNEEHVMLRKIYRGLLNKMHEWRHDQHLEDRNKVKLMREEAKRHIQSLQGLFEDRLKLLKEQESQSRNEQSISVKTQRRMTTDLQKSWKYKQNRKIFDQKNVINQRRQHELLMRREAHKNLLALLATEKWQDSLRFDFK